MKVIGIVGAGQMGAGIAQTAASSGLRVLLSDVDLSSAQKGRDRIAGICSSGIERGKMSEADRDNTLSNIEAIADLEPMRVADMIIEAATEREAVKREIFKSIDGVLSPKAIMATNTSSISITRLAQAVEDPSRFVGMHFFNPVPLMPLLELIKGFSTSEDTIRVAEKFGSATGKTTILSADSPGFVVNRLLLPLLNEAFFAVGERLASIEDIDAGVRLGLGHPMGPLKLADMIGLDTILDILKVYQADFGDQKYRPAPILIKMVEAGQLGKKSSCGFYDYTSKNPTPAVRW